jgi:hypothetical protein
MSATTVEEQRHETPKSNKGREREESGRRVRGGGDEEGRRVGGQSRLQGGRSLEGAWEERRRAARGATVRIRA